MTGGAAGEAGVVGSPPRQGRDSLREVRGRLAEDSGPAHQQRAVKEGGEEEDRERKGGGHSGRGCGSYSASVHYLRATGKWQGVGEGVS